MSIYMKHFFTVNASNNREIADELCVSMRTVQGHLSTIFSKMQVGSRTEAVIQALKEGVVTLENNDEPDPTS